MFYFYLNFLNASVSGDYLILDVICPEIQLS